MKIDQIQYGCKRVLNSHWSFGHKQHTFSNSINQIPKISSTTSRKKIMSSLNPNAEYEELVSVRLVGMMLTIVVRQELRKRILRYSTQTVGTGALNILVTSFIGCVWICISKLAIFKTLSLIWISKQKPHFRWLQINWKNSNFFCLRCKFKHAGQQRWCWC